MGLDIGIISVTYLERPHGHAYEFALEMAIDPNAVDYMHGQGHSWIYFSKPQVRRMLQRFAKQKGLSEQEKADVWAWVKSLPWQGNDIELYFNW